jgi:TonB family protein
MIHVRFSLRYALWITVFVTVGNGESLLAQQTQPPPITTTAQSPTTAPVNQSPQANTGQTKPSELANLEAKVRPSVIWVTTFDPKGNLLRTQSGFFISADGRFVTTARAIEGGVNAVAKTGDGGIYNVTGIVAASKESDLAVLQADVKRAPFLALHKNGNLSSGPGIVMIGSALAGSDGSARQTTITAQQADRLEIAGATPASSIGSPVVNEISEVVGVLTAIGQQTTARPAAALESLLSRVATDTQARWPATAETSPTPKPTPKPRLVYAPAPAFPPGVSQSGLSGSGRFRLVFDANGNVTNVQVVKSTGNPYFDQASIKTLRQWKSAPSQGWAVTVPVTFQTR